MRRSIRLTICGMSFGIFASCGTSGGGGVPPTAPPPGPPPSSAQVAPIIEANCASCHNGSTEPLLTADNIKASKALDELETGAMPPSPHTIGATDKATLISYLR